MGGGIKEVVLHTISCIVGILDFRLHDKDNNIEKAAER